MARLSAARAGVHVAGTQALSLHGADLAVSAVQRQGVRPEWL